MAGVKPSAISSATVAAFKTKLGYLTQEEADLRYPQISEGEPVDLDALLAAKADLASPTFTGTPLVPTAAAGTNTTQAASTEFVTLADNEVINSTNTLRTLRLLGSDIKGYSMGALEYHGSSITLVDNQALFFPVYIDKDATLTGVRISLQTQGSFTADNSNSVALYTYSSGVLTQVAIISNTDGSIWKQPTGTNTNYPFSTPYSASKGLYYIGLLYNNSAQTTAPVVYGTIAWVGNMNSIFNFSNTARLSSTLSAQNTLPASVTLSGNTNSNNIPFILLY